MISIRLYVLATFIYFFSSVGIIFPKLIFSLFFCVSSIVSAEPSAALVCFFCFFILQRKSLFPSLFVFPFELKYYKMKKRKSYIAPLQKN